MESYVVTPEDSFSRESSYFGIMLDKGRQIADAISHRESWEELEYPVSFLVYCSLLSDSPISLEEAFIAERQPTMHTVRVSASGLIVGDHLYPYHDEGRTILHQAVLSHLLEHGKTGVASRIDLIELNKLWTESYIKLSMTEHGKKLQQIFREETREMRQEAKNKFLGYSYMGLRVRYLMEFYPQLNEQDALLLHDELTLLKQQIATEERKYDRKIAQKWSRFDHEEWEIIRKRLIAKFDIKISQEFSIEFNYMYFDRKSRQSYQQEFHDHLISSGILTVDELAIRASFVHKNSHSIDEFVSRIQSCERRYRFRNVYSPATQRLERVEISQKDLPTHETRHTSRITRAFTKVRLAVKAACGKMYEDTFDRDPAVKLSEAYFKSGCACSIKEAKEEFIAILAPAVEGFDIDLSIICDAYISYCRHYYGSIMPKYFEAYKFWGAIPKDEYSKTTSKITQLTQEFNSNLPLESRAAAEQELQMICNELCHVLSTPDTMVEKVFIIPTGVVLLTDSGEILPRNITPTHSIFKTILNVEQYDKWHSVWTSFYSRQLDAFNRVARQAISAQIGHILMTAREELPSVEKRYFDLLTKYKIKCHEEINNATGLFQSLIDTDALETLHDVLSVCHPYIDGIIWDSMSNKNIAELQDRIKSFMSGATHYVAGVVAEHDSNYMLNLSMFVNLCVECSYDAKVMLTLVSTCLATEIFRSFSPGHRETFNRYLPTTTKISKLEFYRISGRRIDSPQERSDLLLRGLFIVEFNRYLEGKLSGEIVTFMRLFVPAKRREY